MARRIKTNGGQQHMLPIKDPRKIKEFLRFYLIKGDYAETPVKKYQAHRNYMLCFIGLNTAFRAEDLLQLLVKDVKYGYIHIKESKTGKVQNFKMNKKFHEEVLDYIEKYELKDNDYMFKGQKKIQNGEKYTQPISRQNGHLIVTKASRGVGIPFKVGMHGLRKTFGYNYIKNGGNPQTLMKMYNHDDYNVTMLYVCWGKDDAEKDRTATYLTGR